MALFSEDQSSVMIQIFQNELLHNETNMHRVLSLRASILLPEQGRPTYLADLPSWEVLGLLLKLLSLSPGITPVLHSFHKRAFRAKTSAYFSDIQVIKGVFISNFSIMWKFSSHRTALYSDWTLFKGFIVLPVTVLSKITRIL